MPVRWSEDGFPYITQGDETVPMILKRAGVKRDANVTLVILRRLKILIVLL